MNNGKDINADILNIEKNYEQLMNDAYRLFPNLSSELKAVSDANVSIDSYRVYLEIMNQSPSVITTNHVN